MCDTRAQAQVGRKLPRECPPSFPTLTAVCYGKPLQAFRETPGQLPSRKGKPGQGKFGRVNTSEASKKPFPPVASGWTTGQRVFLF